MSKDKINELEKMINDKADRKLKNELFASFLPAENNNNFSYDGAEVYLWIETMKGKDIQIKKYYY